MGEINNLLDEGNLPFWTFPDGRRMSPDNLKQLAREMDLKPGKMPKHSRKYQVRRGGKLDVAGAPDAPGVYFFTDSYGDRVKIGVARDSIHERLRGHQASHSRPIVFLAWRVGDRRTERQEHLRWSEYRLHGEWFEYGAELRDYVESLVHEMKTKPPSTDDPQ